ncbi:hypothetical protein GCM10027413_00950 [Conyzicola nivalis]|uniref:DUF4012 domain-containing protein n=1 Tax=Conyzicola nivalis TaxID=1477021 RepID=A0A916SPN0_9MICO|nr:DUF4012 domain-containing protein [Conyzicola nivalis]GGB09911.1 hypothetical protein GCM10010979_25690 [Conyzicola nivalis]
MSATDELRPTAHRPPRKRLIRRWWFWLIVAVLLIVVAAGLYAWALASRVFEVKAELESAQSLASDLKIQASAFDMDGAMSTLDDVSAHTNRAVEIADEPIWSFSEGLPVIGKNLIVVRQLAGVTDDLMVQVATPLVAAVKNVDPASLAITDGAIDVSPFVGAVDAIAEADANLKDTAATLDAIDTADTVEQVSGAKTTLAGLVTSVAPLLETANNIAPLLPATLGVDAPRRYVVMFQNNAESRALGGTALSFAVISIDNGKIIFDETIPAGFKNFVTSTPVLPQPDGVAELFNGELGNFIPNNTLRPSFTTAAQLTQEMWKRDQGYAVDGVVSVDPVALSYILRATGPIPLSTGDVLTSDSLVPLLLNGLYQRFNTKNAQKDNIAQDVVYSEAVDATFTALTTKPLDPTALIDALTQGWNESRIMYWSAHEDEQARLINFGLNGELPVSDEKTERVGVYFADNVGSKMNYYLNQSIELSQATCRGDGLESYRVSATLTNTMDPPFVKQLSTSILGQQYWKMGLAKGVQRLVVMLYAPPGSQIANVSVNGAPYAMPAHHDGDYPVGRVVVDVNPGAAANVTYDLVAGTPGVRTLEAKSTPMVTPTAIATVPLDCATVAAK